MSIETKIQMEGTLESGSVEIKGVRIKSSSQSDEALKVGDHVRILVKEYSNYKAHNGIISHLDKFSELPTVTVCYIESDYSGTNIKFKSINNKTDDAEIVKTEEIDIEGLGEIRASAEKNLEKSIEKKRKELEDEEYKLVWFRQYFGKCFGDV